MKVTSYYSPVPNTIVGKKLFTKKKNEVAWFISESLLEQGCHIQSIVHQLLGIGILFQAIRGNKGQEKCFIRTGFGAKSRDFIL